MTGPATKTETQLSAAARRRVAIGGLVMFAALMASPYVSFLIGENLRARYHFSEAVKFYEYACWRGIVGADPYLPKAMCEYNVGDYRNAVIDASSCITRNPRSSLAHAERGFAYWRLGITDENDFKEARNLDPQVALFYHRNAYRSIKNNANPTVTLELASKATYMQPTLGKAYINRSTANTDLGNYEDAIADADTAIQMGLPNDAAFAIAWGNRARADLHMDFWDDAQFDAKQSMQLDPTNDAGFLYYACGLIGNAKYNEAMAFCDKNQKAHPWLENIRKRASVARPSESEIVVRELLAEIETSDRQIRQVSTGLADALSVMVFFGIPGALVAFLMSKQRRKRETELQEVTDTVKRFSPTTPQPPSPPPPGKLLEPAAEGEYIDPSAAGETTGAGSGG
jgi:tetratricopeptide (TPR) repeat protein